MFGFEIRNLIQISESKMHVSCVNYIVLVRRRLIFVDLKKRDKAFCTIGRFEVTLNLIPDKAFL